MSALGCVSMCSGCFSVFSSFKGKRKIRNHHETHIPNFSDLVLSIGGASKTIRKYENGNILFPS